MPIAPDRPLDLLEQAGLVSPGGAVPEPEYVFKHSLVQETAYASLVRPRRIELHRQVAEAIESLGTSADTSAAMLAIHFKEAGLPAKAFAYAARAGDEAQRTYAHAEALANYDLALSLAPGLAPEALGDALRNIYSRRGSIFEVMGHHQEALANYEAMRSEAARLQDGAMQADALNRLATVKAVTFDRSDAEILLGEALAIAERSKDLPMIARTLWNYGLRYRFDEPEKATEYFRKALAIVERPDCQALDVQSGIRELEGFILADLRVTQIVSGRHKASIEAGRRALEVFRSLGNKAMVADGLAGAALTAHYSGKPEDALQFSREGIEISRSIGNPWGLVYNSWIQLDIAFDRAQFEPLRHDCLDLLPTAQQVSFPIFVGVIHSILARIYVVTDQPERAGEHAREGLAPFTTGAGQISWRIWGLGAMGLALLAQGKTSEAGEYLEPVFRTYEGTVSGFQGYFLTAAAVLRYALETGQEDRGLAFADWMIKHAEAEGLNRLSMEVRHWRGRVHRALGHLDAAVEDLELAGREFEQIQVRNLQWLNDAHLARVYAEAGRPERAEASRARCRSTADLILSGLSSPDLREGFARTVAATLTETAS
jgi:tetratricopeptide (TPR) repeat protein